jgi:methylenetetrahydrofolate dehydrogenase (NADP+)/methenyltetrahydrofolate cyclohydrolase
MDGKKVAASWRARIQQELSDSGSRPQLVLVGVGENPESKTYVKLKSRMAAKAGMISREDWLGANATQREIEETVLRASGDPSVDGIMVQLPLPDQVDWERVLDCISPGKDVDGLTSAGLGQLAADRKAWLPATVLGVIELLAYYHVVLIDRHVVILGSDRFVGIPMAMAFSHRGATVTMIPENSSQAQSIAPTADILIAVAGQPETVSADMIKSGAVVIDAGSHHLEDGSLVGNTRHQEVSAVASLITPVPGGVGPMTIAALLQNTWAAHAAKTGKEGRFAKGSE